MRNSTKDMISPTTRPIPLIAILTILALSVSLDPAFAQAPAGWSRYMTDNGMASAVFPCPPISQNQDIPVPQGMIRMQSIIGMGEQAAFTVLHQRLPNGTNGVAPSQYIEWMINYQTNDQQALILEHQHFMYGQMNALEVLFRNSDGVFNRVVTLIKPSGTDLYQFSCASFSRDYTVCNEAVAFFGSTQVR